MVSTKDHGNRKPHMKSLWSFIASVLKTILKNLTPYILLLKCYMVQEVPKIVDLVTKEGNTNFEKDIGSFYVNKNGCLEFINAHGELSLRHVAGAVLTDE